MYGLYYLLYTEMFYLIPKDFRARVYKKLHAKFTNFDALR